MRLYFINLYRFLSEAHVVITTAAFCQVKMINVIFKIEDKNDIAFFVALTTFCIYNFYSVFTAFFHPENFETHRINFWRRYRYLYLYLLLSVSVILIFKYYFLFPVFFNFPRHHYLVFSILAILSVFYGVPMFGNKSLRDLPFVKIFIISTVWAFMVVLLPVIIYSPPVSNTILGWMLIEKICFLLAITLLCDIYDVEWDKKGNVKTIPVYFGVRATVNLIYALLIFTLALNIYFYFENTGFSLSVLISSVLTAILSALLTSVFRKKINYLSESVFFKDGVDGLLICSWLFLIVEKYF